MLNFWRFTVRFLIVCYWVFGRFLAVRGPAVGVSCCVIAMLQWFRVIVVVLASTIALALTRKRNYLSNVTKTTALLGIASYFHLSSACYTSR